MTIIASFGVLLNWSFNYKYFLIQLIDCGIINTNKHKYLLVIKLLCDETTVVTGSYI